MDYSDLIGKMVAYAGTTAEKSIRSVLGGVIRGVAIASLQNEVLAEVVSAIAGTLAKKVAEQFMYTWLNQFISSSNTTATDAEKAAAMDLFSQVMGIINA